MIWFEIPRPPGQIAPSYLYRAVLADTAQILGLTVGQATIHVEHQDLGTKPGSESTVITHGFLAIA